MWSSDHLRVWIHIMNICPTIYNSTKMVVIEVTYAGKHITLLLKEWVKEIVTHEVSVNKTIPHLLSWLMKYLSIYICRPLLSCFLKVSKPHLPSLHNDISMLCCPVFSVENLFTLCHCKGSHCNGSHLFVINTIHPWSHPKNCWSHGVS